CHSAAAVVLEAERRGWPALPGAALPYVTAGLDVRYLRPSPLDQPVELRAVVREAAEAQMLVDVSLVWDGKPRAEATALWKRWRPRPANLSPHSPGRTRPARGRTALIHRCHGTSSSPTRGSRRASISRPASSKASA
ncbi:hypothetical protein K7G98_33360, partial [Saccharothrix sp. MB29]|nr:hypothetical protein [Saccharothrix sp. MB29]